MFSNLKKVIDTFNLKTAKEDENCYLHFKEVYLVKSTLDNYNLDLALKIDNNFNSFLSRDNNLRADFRSRDISLIKVYECEICACNHYEVEAFHKGKIYRSTLSE